MLEAPIRVCLSVWGAGRGGRIVFVILNHKSLWIWCENDVDSPKHGGKYLCTVYVDHSKGSRYLKRPQQGESCLDLGSICRDMDAGFLCVGHLRLRRQQKICDDSGGRDPSVRNDPCLQTSQLVESNILVPDTEGHLQRWTETPPTQCTRDWEIPPSFRTHLRWWF